MASSLVFACQIASSAFLICSVLLTSAVGAVSTQVDRLSTVGFASIVGNGTFSTIVRARLECAALCSKDDQCDLCSFDTDTKICQFDRDIRARLAFFTTITSSVMIRRSLKMVLVHTEGLIDQSLYWQGFMCESFGGNVAAYSQVSDALVNHGLHVAQCSRMSNGNSYTALQYDVPGIGNQGINQCMVPTTCEAIFCVIPGLLQ